MLAKGGVGHGVVPADAENRKAFVDEVFLHQLIDGRKQLAPTEIAERAEDHHRARVGAIVRRDGLHLSGWTRGNDLAVGAHECLTSWPPNSLRSAAMTFAPNESV